MTFWFYLLLKPNDLSLVGEAPSNLNVKVVSVDLLSTTTGVTATGGPGGSTFSNQNISVKKIWVAWDKNHKKFAI